MVERRETFASHAASGRSGNLAADKSYMPMTRDEASDAALGNDADVSAPRHQSIPRMHGSSKIASPAEGPSPCASVLTRAISIKYTALCIGATGSYASLANTGYVEISYREPPRGSEPRGSAKDHGEVCYSGRAILLPWLGRQKKRSEMETRFGMGLARRDDGSRAVLLKIRASSEADNETQSFCLRRKRDLAKFDPWFRKPNTQMANAHHPSRMTLQPVHFGR
ncbi:uncharacterized protein UV8b_00058 [Ustilaginoidea virens]|uniref:Uncharacterized protein n=1 Tax=Ustilaginoidea virens TaxID=1159556 RepID=A0A8E5ME03_USTVR|nr:uncharacterized protein UV8b_00058 [Ustilaginoidea virens]QUC15817.1 hypothetical protein UV8b_00058 [Ustilaginoidea virens]